jgi:DNA-binding response OmpR family regulator
MELKLQDVWALNLISGIRSKKENLPVIIVTEHANKENCIAAINVGVTALVEKPVDLGDLKEIMEKHRFKGFELKMSHDRKAVYSKNAWIDLTSTEYKILETLKIARRRMTRAELQSGYPPH